MPSIYGTGVEGRDQGGGRREVEREGEGTIGEESQTRRGPDEETGMEERERNKRTSNKEGVSVGRGGAKKIKPRARWWKELGRWFA